MTFLVKQYRAGWKPRTNDGKITCKSTTGEVKSLTLSDPAEFSAILVILATSDSATIENGVIWTGAEEIEG